MYPHPFCRQVLCQPGGPVVQQNKNQLKSFLINSIRDPFKTDGLINMRYDVDDLAPFALTCHFNPLPAGGQRLAGDI